MLAKFSGLNPKGPYLSLENEKKKIFVVLTYSIKRASEIKNVLLFFCCKNSPLMWSKIFLPY